MRIFSFIIVLLLASLNSGASEKTLKDIAVVVKDSKYGIIDANGIVLVPCSYEYLKITCSDLIVARKQGKYGYIDRHGKVKIDFLYEATTGFYDKKAVVTQNGKDKFINEKGLFLTGKQYDAATIFSEGLAGTSNAGVWEFVDEKEKVVISAGFDFVFAFHNGYCIASRKNKFGVVNKKGEPVIPFEYDVILESNTPQVYLAYQKLRGRVLKIKNSSYEDMLRRDVYRFINVPDVSPLDRECEPHFSSANLMFQDDTMGLINLHTGKITAWYDKIKPLSSHYFYCENQGAQNMEISIADTSGMTVGNFNEYTITGAGEKLLFVNSKEGGLIGGITIKKDTLVSFIYTDIVGMHKDLLLAARNDGYFLFKKSGEKIGTKIPFEIDKCIFWEKVIVVKSGDKYGLIDYTGKIIQDPQFEKIIRFTSDVLSE